MGTVLVVSADLLAEAVRPILAELSAGRCAEAVALAASSRCSPTELRTALDAFPAVFGVPPLDLASFINVVPEEGTGDLSVWVPLFEKTGCRTDLEARFAIVVRDGRLLLTIEDLRVS